MNEVKIYFSLNPGGQLPTKAHETDAGWDLYISRSASVAPGEAGDIHTDICLAVPPGWYANIKPRSSTFVRHGVHVVEGIIDAGYRGELFMQVINPSRDKWVSFYKGDRIAQILILPVPRVSWYQTDNLPASERGQRGFGMSGR